MAQFEQVQAAVEQACSQMHDPATRGSALATLEQFQAAADLCPACQHIVAASSSSAAQFQAALALAKHVRGMPAQAREAMRIWVLEQLAAHRLENVVTGQLLRTVTGALVAGCADGSFEQAIGIMLADIQRMGASSVQMRVLGLRTSLAIVEEFDDDSTDGLVQAHLMFEQSGALLQLEELALRELQQLDGSGPRQLCKLALGLCLAGFSWHWGSRPRSAAYSDEFEARPGLLELLISVHSRLRSDEALSRQARQLAEHPELISLQVTGVLASAHLRQCLPDLAGLSVHVLSCQPFDDEQPWEQMEAFDALLDAWVVLSTSRETPEFARELAPAARQLFQQYLQAALVQSARIDSEDEFYQDDLIDDRLVGIACVARMDAAGSCGMLTSALDGRIAQLSAQQDTTAALEMSCIVRLAAFVLADSVEGETPEVPEQFVILDVTSAVVLLTNTLFRALLLLPQLSLDGSSLEWRRAVMILTLGLSGFLRRWSATWLFLEPDSTQISDHFGNEQTACNLLETIINIVDQWLRGPLAIEMAPSIAELLATLTTRHMVRKVLTRLDAWWRVIGLLGQLLGNLEAQDVRKLVQAILRGSYYENHRCETEVWPMLMGSGKLHHNAHTLCAIGRGAAVAVQVLPPEVRKIALQHSASLLPNLVADIPDLSILGNAKAATRMLKYGCALMETSGYLEERDASLTALIASLHQGLCQQVCQVQAAVGRETEKEAFDGEFSVVAALLLTLETAIEYTGAESTLVQGSLPAMLTLMRTSVLDVPKVQQRAHSMLNTVAHSADTALLQLAPEVFQAVVTVLDSGIKLTEPNVRMHAIGSLSAISAGILKPSQNPSVLANAAAFCPWALHRLLSMMLFEARATNLILDGVADSLHALVLGNLQNYEAAAHGILTKLPIQSQASLGPIFASLVPSHTVQQFNRITKVAYRKAARLFIKSIQELGTQVR